MTKDEAEALGKKLNLIYSMIASRFAGPDVDITMVTRIRVGDITGVNLATTTDIKSLISDLIDSEQNNIPVSFDPLKPFENPPTINTNQKGNLKNYDA